MNDYDFNKIKKITVNYTVIIFGLIIILIFILLALYYLTPNNYKIELFDDNKFIKKKEVEYKIKPNSTLNIIVKTDEYLKSSNIPINYIIKNWFKSQNVLIDKDNDLIKIKYGSEIFLSNNSNEEKKIIIQFYSHI